MKPIPKSWKRIVIGLFIALVVLPVVWYDRAFALGNEPADPFAEYVYYFKDGRYLCRLSNQAVRQGPEPGFEPFEIALRDGYKAIIYAKPRKDIEDAHFRELNAYRATFGLPPLQRLPELDAYARLRSAENAFIREQNDYFSHTRPSGRSCLDFENAASENMHYDQAWESDPVLGDPRSASEIAYDMFDSYRRSPAHNGTMKMKRPSRDIYVGIGIVELHSIGGLIYFNTQIYGALPQGSIPREGSFAQSNSKPQALDDLEQMNLLYQDIRMPSEGIAVRSGGQLSEEEKADILSRVKNANRENEYFLLDVKEVVGFDNATEELVLRFKDNTEGTYPVGNVTTTTGTSPEASIPLGNMTKIPEQKGTNYGYAIAPAGSVDPTTRVRVTQKENGKQEIILVDGKGKEIYSDELMLVTVPAPKGQRGSYRVKVDGVYTTFELSADGNYVTMPMVFSRDGKMNREIALERDGVKVEGSRKALPGQYRLSVIDRGNARYAVNLLNKNGKKVHSDGPVMVSMPAPRGVGDVYRLKVDGKWTTFEVKGGIVRFALVF